MNLEEAVAMAQAAEDSGRRLMYGLHMRFSPDSECAMRYLEAGRLGDAYHATVHAWRRRKIPGLGSWFTTKALAGGGVLIDVGVHLLDLSHCLLGATRPGRGQRRDAQQVRLQRRQLQPPDHVGPTGQGWAVRRR